MISLSFNGQTIRASLVENSSTRALLAIVKQGPLKIAMEDYANMEKVGPLGIELPRNDEQIDAVAGDLILYQGDKLVIYYAPNSWTFTRLGRVEGIDSTALREKLGEGEVEITISAV